MLCKLASCRALQRAVQLPSVSVSIQALPFICLRQPFAFSPFCTSAVSDGDTDNSPAITEDTLVIYVDGSCTVNQNVATNVCPAGWGAVVLKGCTGTQRFPSDCSATDNPDCVVELWGPVCTEKSSSQFLGAEHGSNNTGELSAVAQVLRWLLYTDKTDRPVLIRHDSVYAANIAKGVFKASKNKDLAKTVQKLFSVVSKRRSLAFSHVRAHSSHRWNDRADKLAKRGATGAMSDHQNKHRERQQKQPDRSNQREQKQDRRQERDDTEKRRTAYANMSRLELSGVCNSRGVPCTAKMSKEHLLLLLQMQVEVGELKMRQTDDPDAPRATLPWYNPEDGQTKIDLS